MVLLNNRANKVSALYQITEWEAQRLKRPTLEANNSRPSSVEAENAYIRSTHPKAFT